METEAGLGGHYLNEEYIAAESNQEGSSTLRKTRRSAMSEILNSMTLLCFIYHIDFKRLLKVHKLSVAEDLRSKVRFLMVDSL